MKYIVIDIETVPLKIEHEDIKEYLMDKKIGGKRRSLDPNYSKIIVICVKEDNETKVFSGDDEEKLLKEFWDFIKDEKNAVFVTFNGYSFDWPFIFLRSIINKLPIPFTLNMNRWSMENSNHFDLMLFFSQQGTFTNPNLEILGKMHGIDLKREKIKGEDIEKLYLDGKWDLIKQHCKEDVEILDKVFKKFCLSYLKDRKNSR